MAFPWLTGIPVASTAPAAPAADRDVARLQRVSASASIGAAKDDMLKIQKRDADDLQRCSANLLPCRIHHDGPVDAHHRYWKSETSVDGTKTAYFRGRKLQGLSVKVPDGYQGIRKHLAPITSFRTLTE